MNDLLNAEQEKNVLRWGGLSGMLGGILFILAWVVALAGPVGMDDPVELVGWVTRFPDIQAARVVENIVYLLALLLEIPLLLALYQALRKTNRAPALFGTGIAMMGLASFIVSTTPHVAHAKLSSLYHAPGATPADQAAIVLLWQAVWGLNDVMTYIGFFVVPAGLILLGAAMFGSPAFGKGIGSAAIGFGAVGVIAAVLQFADPASMVGALSYFACILFYFVAGWKVFRLSSRG